MLLSATTVSLLLCCCLLGCKPECSYAISVSVVYSKGREGVVWSAKSRGSSQHSMEEGLRQRRGAWTCEVRACEASAVAVGRDIRQGPGCGPLNPACAECPRVTTRPPASQEDNLLLRLATKLGTKSWTAIAAHFGANGRSAKSCRLR